MAEWHIPMGQPYAKWRNKFNLNDANYIKRVLRSAIHPLQCSS